MDGRPEPVNYERLVDAKPEEVLKTAEELFAGKGYTLSKRSESEFIFSKEGVTFDTFLVWILIILCAGVFLTVSFFLGWWDFYSEYHWFEFYYIVGAFDGAIIAVILFWLGKRWGKRNIHLTLKESGDKTTLVADSEKLANLFKSNE